MSVLILNIVILRMMLLIAVINCDLIVTTKGT